MNLSRASPYSFPFYLFIFIFFKWLITHVACQINVESVKIAKKGQYCKGANF